MLFLLSALASERYDQLAPTALDLAFGMDAPLVNALVARDHTTAITLLKAINPESLSEGDRYDLAFLLAWSMNGAGQQASASKSILDFARSPSAPSAYVGWLAGSTLVESGKYTDALPFLEEAAVLDSKEPIAIEVKARLALADVYQKLERTKDARAVYEDLALRPDPANGSATALSWLAMRSTPPASTEYNRRIYRYYPGYSVQFSPALEDVAIRGDVMQEKGSWSDAVALLEPRLAEASTRDAVGCRLRYAYGRAQHKLNNLTRAAEILVPLGKGCKGVEDERGGKALYVAGKSLERKKDWAGAAAAYRQIPELYPNHSMADDGYALGGIALQEAGDLSGARRLWAEGIKAAPGGDMAAEIAWRLAWGAYLAGDVTEAIKWADTSVETIAPTMDVTHSLAAAYWAGRWRAWPDESGAVRPENREKAVALLEGVAKKAPWHYYGILASARLKQLDAAKYSALNRPAMDAASAAWQVRPEFLGNPAVHNALGLIRLGLYTDAMAEFSSLDESSLTGAEMAIITGTQTRSGKFLLAHDRLRSWLKTHPADTLGPNTFKILRQAYPEQYWSEIKTATKDFAWDARVFQALVREESNFNPEIKSHAGACGLSQLMPGTASSCAKRMGVAYSSSKIWDTQTNLNIGAWYLNTLHSRYAGNSAVALSAYNAGEGNADRWLAARPGTPTDSYTESITFRETRFYVRRVLSTYQTYHLLYDGGPVYLDWSKWMDHAVF